MNRRKATALCADGIRSRRPIHARPYRCLGLGLAVWGFFILGLLPAGLAVQLHFVPTGYPIPPTVAQAVHLQLPRLIQAHQALFRHTLPAELSVQIQVLPTRPEYAAVAKTLGFAEPNMLGFSRTSKSRDLASGLFRVKEARIVTWAQRDEAVLTAVLLHELTHTLTDACLWRAPDWYMEGSAELLGAPAVGPHRLRRQAEPQRWQALVQLLQNQRLPALREFMRTSRHGWDRLFTNRTDLAYTAAYSLFHFFMAHPAATRLLIAAVNSPDVALAANPNLACADFLHQRWPGGLPLLEKGWHQWIRQQAETNGTPARTAKPASGPRP
jgi:hypothetical protein